MTWKVRLFAAMLIVAPSFAAADQWQSDMMPTDRIYMPEGAAKGVAVLMSDGQGWSAQEEATAQQLKADHVAVIGVDLPSYAKAIDAMAPVTQKEDPWDPVCSYLVSDIESLSQQVQRASGSTDYVTPVVAGFGTGGGLALDIIDQTPDVTIGGTVVADPASAVPITNDLCTPMGYLTNSRGEVYQLPKGTQQDPVTVLLSKSVEPDIEARVLGLKATSTNVTVAENASVAPAAMAREIETRISASRAAMADIPVTILSTKPKQDVMAIILSGDGGWRDIDASIGEMMQKQGIPVVGVDSLRYFWSRRTPEETGRDIATLIKHYHDLWGVNNVILVGYSFGADVLPAAFNTMPDAAKHRVKLVSLLGLSTAADWTITVDGWLGSHGGAATPTKPDVAQMPLARVQCVFGSDEDASGCPDAAALGAEAVKVDGGHHFDGNYAEVEQDILAAYAKRAAEPADTGVASAKP